jgi:hypothetical protein
VPRGGRRSGTPGALYPNRSDLRQPIQVASGQTYGMRAEQVAAQRAIPLAGATPVPPPAAGSPPDAGTRAGQVSAAPPGPLPGQLVPLDAPSQRPDEPVTAGLPVGPGGGPELLGDLQGEGEDVEMQLRAIYARFPNEHIRRAIEFMENE